MIKSNNWPFNCQKKNHPLPNELRNLLQKDNINLSIQNHRNLFDKEKILSLIPTNKYLNLNNNKSYTKPLSKDDLFLSNMENNYQLILNLQYDYSFPNENSSNEFDEKENPHHPNDNYSTNSDTNILQANNTFNQVSIMQRDYAYIPSMCNLKKNNDNQLVHLQTLISSTNNQKKIQKRSKKIMKNIRKSEILKNITKNFAKNCASFAISSTAYPLLLEVLPETEYLPFAYFIKSNRSELTSIANFRNMLLVQETDNEQITNLKKAFQHISIIFIRDYAYNWIFHSSRIKDKKGHIFTRAKMLRRVQNPQNFFNIH